MTDESEESDLPESDISSDITSSCSIGIVCESNTSSEAAIGIGSQSRTTSTSAITASVARPTCHIKFPLIEIVQHAGRCCEINLREASLNRSWVLDSIDLTHDKPDVYTSPQENDVPVNTASTKKLIETIMSNISDEIQYRLEENLYGRTICLHVNSIGEETGDGGGPRHDLFTGTVSH